MAADPKLSYDAVDAMMDGLSALLNSGKLVIWDDTGSTPTTVLDANSDNNTNVKLAELTLNADFAPVSVDGVLTANAITADTSANASGTCDYFRLTNSAQTAAYFQGTCGPTTGYDLNMNSATISSGAEVSVTSLTLTLARE